MKVEERLSGALQENILTVLAFDDRNAKLVRHAVSPQLFESAVFKEIAGHAIDFIDQFGEPIKEHLPDQLEDILKGDDTRKASLYKRVLNNLYESRNSVNADYVLSQLHKFVRWQRLKDAVIKAVEAIEDGRIETAEVELHKGLKSQVSAFEPGTNLSSTEDLLAVLDDPEEEGFDLGITPLDRRGVIPRRKELLLFLAARGKGKSWFITHVTKQALLHRWSCVIVTLEMSEKRYAARMLQSFFSISKRDGEVKVTQFVRDRDGSLSDLIREAVTRPTMQDDDIKAKITKRAKREFTRRPPLRIKEFPSKSLDANGLRAYLDGLERFEGFTPDLICVDYPDLMKLDAKNLRIEIGDLVAELRGIAVERNAAMVVCSQGNRESETAKLVTGNMAAEDISKLATADVCITYSQTPSEQKLNLARLFAEKARNEEAKQQILITQAYSIGQFCLDAIEVQQDYWEIVEPEQHNSEEQEDKRPQRRRRNA